MATNNAINLKQAGVVSYDAAGTFTGTAITQHNVLVAGASNIIGSVAPGTSGNVLTSNGTDWTSAAASGGTNYALTMMTSGAGSSTPADATTYFLQFGAVITTSTASQGNLQKLFIPAAGTLNICYGTCRVAGTLGSAGNCTLSIRLNNTTDTAVTTTLALTAVDNTFNNTSLGITVAAGDYIEFKLATPTWATNPTLVSLSMVVYVS